MSGDRGGPRPHQTAAARRRLIHEVRCLGPGMPEHTFMTDDPRGHRICDRCRKMIAALPTAAIQTEDRET